MTWGEHPDGIAKGPSWKNSLHYTPLPNSRQQLGRRMLLASIVETDENDLGPPSPIGIVPAMQTDDLQNLPLVEKLRLVEQLWDDISTSSEAFPLHPWQSAEARRRAAEFDANPEMGLTRKEVWERVERSDG